MSVRNFLNRNPMIAVAVVVLAIALAGWAIYSSAPQRPASGTTGYYSSDDGQTWFKVDTKEMPPITYGGKPAVRVRLFTCPDGKKFVGYLERYTDEAKALLDQFEAAKAAMKSGAPKPNLNIAAVRSAAETGRQVKKPGDKEWTNGSGPAGAATKVTCPNGEAATPAQ